MIYNSTSPDVCLAARSFRLVPCPPRHPNARGFLFSPKAALLAVSRLAVKRISRPSRGLAKHARRNSVNGMWGSVRVIGSSQEAQIGC